MPPVQIQEDESAASVAAREKAEAEARQQREEAEAKEAARLDAEKKENERIAAERAKADAAEAQRLRDKEESDARMKQFETILTGAYNAKVGAQPPPAPVTDEDFDTNPAEAQRRVAREEASEIVKQVGAVYSQVVGGLAESDFNRTVSELPNKRFGKYAKKEVEQYFRDHPEAKLIAGKVNEVYHNAVGQNIEEYLEREAQEKGDPPLVKMNEGDGPAPPRQSHRISVSEDRSAPISSRPKTPNYDKQDAGPALSNAEKKVLGKFAALGIEGMSTEEDWSTWRDELYSTSREEIPNLLEG